MLFASFSAMLILLLGLGAGALCGYITFLAVKALRRYLREEKPASPTSCARSIGEAIRTHRTERGMTQEFVAAQLDVSRQAVSKWESGAADPSTGNLLALAELFGVSAAELLPKKEK